MKNITQQSFELDVLKSNQPVMVDFYTTWCGPCNAMSPVFESLSKEYEGKVTFGKVNAAEEDKLAEKLGVFSVPTFLFFKDGKLVKSIIGIQSKSVIKSHLDALCST